MNLDDPRHPWRRLAAAARTARGELDAAAPHGFAARVVARAWARPDWPGSLLERFALRAVGVAGLLAALSVAMNYPALTGAMGAEWRDEPVMLPADDIGVMIELLD
jgi:hypothetical protein